MNNTINEFNIHRFTNTQSITGEVSNASSSQLSPSSVSNENKTLYREKQEFHYMGV